MESMFKWKSPSLYGIRFFVPVNCSWRLFEYIKALHGLQTVEIWAMVALSLVVPLESV